MPFPGYPVNPCPKVLGGTPVKLPHLDDNSASFMLGHTFPCSGVIAVFHYYRANPTGTVFVGIWRQVTSDTYLLKHKIELRPDNVGLHRVFFTEPIAVHQGDFIGIHHSRVVSRGVIPSTYLGDYPYPQEKLVQTIVADVFDEDIRIGETINLRNREQVISLKAFAIQFELDYRRQIPTPTNGNLLIFTSELS